MNKMGLAAINFDTTDLITTGGFIKPEARSDRLGVQSKSLLLLVFWGRDLAERF
jgi:hypothetical protein